jgi:bisphosphoglycerate-independent phosphoglycerate mutase (AlkP superfamily)
MAEGKDLRRGAAVAAPAVQGMRLFDVAPTILEAFKIHRRPQMQGSAIQWPLARAV